MIRRYFKLKDIADMMVHNGVSDLDPRVRFIMRQLWKIYHSMTPEDKHVVDFKEEMELQRGC